MALIYLTGLSGTGKSAVCQELVKRGYEVYEVDRRTKVHRIRLNRSWVEGLAAQARDRLIIISGVRPRDEEAAVLDLFSQVIYLTTDQATLRHRLTTRTHNDYGKDPAELKRILGWAKEADAYHKQAGTVMIDSTKPLNEVVSEVIEAATKL